MYLGKLPYLKELTILIELFFKVNNKNPNVILLTTHNEILYVDDTSEQEVYTITDTTETKRRKVRSNQISKVSVRKEQRYDDSDHQMNVP